jgi:hypothetical protein
MPLRFISISKVLFDHRWNELGPIDLGAPQQGSIYNMIVMKAKSPSATVKIKVVGEEHPVELSFSYLSMVRIGSGMIAYESMELEANGIKELAVGSIDKEI